MSDRLSLQDGSPPDIYFVDLDGTLLSTSSEKYFLLKLIRRGYLGPLDLARFFLAYLLHPVVTFRQGKGWNRFYLKGLSPEAVNEMAASCAEELRADYLRPWTLNSIEELSASGSSPIILSASLSPLATGITRELGADAVFASDPEEVEGSFTGRLTGTRPWGRGKLTIAEEICKSRGTRLSRCAAAGDSWPDRYLLEACGCPVAVCPDRRLKAMARRNGWKTVECSHTRFA